MAVVTKVLLMALGASTWLETAGGGKQRRRRAGKDGEERDSPGDATQDQTRARRELEGPDLRGDLYQL